MAASPTNSDEFGLSSADDEELLAAEATSLKRKAVDDLSTESIKRPCNNEAQARNMDVATEVLQKQFKMKSFRLKQQSAISRLLDGESAVVVFPTGGGKSLCYQVPGVCFRALDRLQGKQAADGGITLVVSPLIALMKDQVDTLKRLGIRAAVMDSTKTRDEHLATVDAMRNGELDILYCAPERLNNEGFVGSMANVRGGIRLLAVDEAHCISEWGHAFRPDYLKVARFAKEMQVERVVALTATATPKVAEDICKAFSVPHSGLFRTPTYRPNLRLYAKSYQTKKQSYPDLCAFLKAHPGPSIVYVTLQKHTEELAERLRQYGFKARCFHAGMKVEEKTASQDEFMGSNDMIIVATIAFGMGIDKANIRNIIHYDIPRSLEGYSQEIGRAGRDGLESYCMLFLCGEDLHLRESFARGDLPSKASIENLLHEVLSHSAIQTPLGPVIEQNLYEQSRKFDIKPTVLASIYAQLELRFELIRATTPKYTAYSYKILTATNSDRTPAANVVRSTSKAAKTWTHIDVDAAAKTSPDTTRADLVSKLNTWNDERKIELKTSGVVNLFRVLKKFPLVPVERQKIVDALYKELEVREQQDLARIKDVMGLVAGEECFAKALAQHFGDGLPEGKECGQCTWCNCHRPVEKPTPPQRPWDSKAFFRVLEACPDRDDPRYLARIAFGIGSPRVTQAKLQNSAVFGSMDDHDFMTLLAAFKKICDKR